VQNKYSVVICTCDSYEDAWHPLFSLFEKYWPGIKDVPIILNTETKVFQHPGFHIQCPQLFSNREIYQKVTWSIQLKETLLNVVDTDFVLLFLEDFYLRSCVNQNKLDFCLNFMQLHKNIANIALYPCPPPSTPTKEHPWLLKRSKSSPYLFTLQAGLWRRDRLISFLRDHENPWNFEIWGSIRARRYSDDFYAISNNPESLIFNYEHAIVGGLWKPFVKDLFIKENISHDFSTRNFYLKRIPNKGLKRNWFKTAWNIYQSLKP